METGPLKSFATWARTELIKEVSARMSAVLAPGSSERVEEAAAVKALETAVKASGGEAVGRAKVADRVAYIWFNRIIALRFMDANGYTGVGVVSPYRGQLAGQPEVLADAKRGIIDGEVVSERTAEAIAALLDGTRRSINPQGEAYSLLLAEYCRYWHRSMPFMFEREGDYTELLIPANLLADDSVLARAVAALTEEVCRDVEVIGWLYQFYISERKDEVFAGFKKNKKAGADEIPAATQLFTPHWIVRYLVENSLGRLWMLNHPESRLVDQMDYYIAPVDEETGFLEITSPEDLTVIDPACGSGHMLTYAFDLLYAIYEEQGYAPSEIPMLILTHNLFGIEIDPRAGALAAFALTMKAAAKRKLFLKNMVSPNTRVLDKVHFDPAELDYLWSLTKGNGLARGDADQFWNAFEHADTFGSLIQPKEQHLLPMKTAIKGASADGDLLYSKTARKAAAVVVQAEFLSKRYSVVVANPPYMGQASMGEQLAAFVARGYADAKADLGIAFIYRNLALALHGGLVGMITLQSWMFLASFVAVRARVTSSNPPLHLLHLGTGAFDSIGGAVVATAAYVLGNKTPDEPADYFRLTDPQSEAGKAALFKRALFDEVSSVRYGVAPNSFTDIAGAPMAYWLSDFESFKRPHLVTAWRSGGRLKTHDTARYVRYWWEVSHQSERWLPLVKGGEFRRWFGNRDFVVDWAPQSTAEYDSHGGLYPESSRGKAGITWTMISGQPAFRLKAADDEFDSASPTILPTDPDADTLAVLGYLNSAAALEILAAINPTINNRVTDVLALPVPETLEIRRGDVRALAKQAVAATRALDALNEVTPEVAEPPVVQGQWTKVADAVRFSISRAIGATEDLLAAEQGLDGIFPAGGTFAPRRGWLGPTADAKSRVIDLVSYAVGCMFGRYSLDKRGLVLADQGVTLEHYLTRIPQPTFAPDRDNVIPIVDGDWFEDDIVERFRQFLRVAFGEQHFEQNLRFVTDSLGVKNLRDYFVKSFYKDHVRRYKKRPIYWLFSSPKGSFNALIYMHRYTPSTVSTVLNEYLREFHAKIQASLTQAERANDGRETERLRKVLVELEEYEHDVLYPLATQQIAIDLDDGVKVNYPKLGAALRKIPGLEAIDE